MVEVGDVVSPSVTKFEEEAEQDVFDKPESSNSAIMEDRGTLDLYETGGVVEVDCDSSRDTSIITDGEPEDAVELNSNVIQAGLDGRAGYSSSS